MVSVPPRWIMSQHTKLPELSPEDTDGFLQIEAEKGFPCDPAQLQITRSAHRSAESIYVTQLAVRTEQVAQLTAVLKAAGLKPVSISLGLAALPGVIAPAGTGRITLQLDPKGATLLVSAGGGIVTLRTFEAMIGSEAGETVVNGPALAREVRITYEQVPPDLRSELRTLFLTGDDTMARQMEEILRDWARDAGLEIERGSSPKQPGAERIAEQLAARVLAGDGPALEFLPPRPSQWSRLMARYSSKRLATAGFAAAALAVLAIGAFGWQEFQRWQLRTDWQEMETEVGALDTVQSRIREYRPWYDESFRNLSILRRVTEAFPDNGSVTAKSVEIHGTTNIIVSVSGTARDSAALLNTTDELRKAREVQGLKIEQIRGKVPAQFTFTFRWNAASGS